MPVPQTFTTGAFGFETRWSASPMHTLRLPWPISKHGLVFDVDLLVDVELRLPQSSGAAE